MKGGAVSGSGSPQTSTWCDNSATDGPTISGDCPTASTGSGGAGTLSSDQSDELPPCDAVPGEPSNPPGVDRISRLLQQHLDPDGTHSGDALFSGGSVEAGDQPTALYAGMNWVESDRTGAVDISVEDSQTAGPSADCQDHATADGPTVTCVQQTLADGTTVVVGHGQRDGAERVTVRYDRPDGQVVIATADEATDQWWTDGSGPGPLSSPPATVDQLVALVQDPASHL